MNWLYIYIYPHISSLLRLPPSHPPYPIPLGGHDPDILDKGQKWFPAFWAPCPPGGEMPGPGAVLPPTGFVSTLFLRLWGCFLSCTRENKGRWTKGWQRLLLDPFKWYLFTECHDLGPMLCEFRVLLKNITPYPPCLANDWSLLSNTYKSSLLCLPVISQSLRYRVNIPLKILWRFANDKPFWA